MATPVPAPTRVSARAAGGLRVGMPACRARPWAAGRPGGSLRGGNKALPSRLCRIGPPRRRTPRILGRSGRGRGRGHATPPPHRLRYAPPRLPLRVRRKPAGGAHRRASGGRRRGPRAGQIEAGLEGFEPSTAGLRVRCSTWLSHRPGTGCTGRYYKRCMRSGSGAGRRPRRAPPAVQRSWRAPDREVQAAAPSGALLPGAGHGRRNARLVVLVQYRVEDDRDRHVVHALFLGQELLVGVQGNVHGDRAAAL